MKIFKERLKRFFIVLLVIMLMLNPYIVKFFGYADADNRIFINEVKAGDTFKEGERVRIVSPHSGTQTLKVHFGDKTEIINSTTTNRIETVYNKIIIKEEETIKETFTFENIDFGSSFDEIIAFKYSGGLYILKDGNNYAYKAYRVCDENDFIESNDEIYVTEDFYNDLKNAVFDFYITKEEMSRVNGYYSAEIFDITFPTIEKDNSITLNWKCTSISKDGNEAINEIYFTPVTNGYANNFYEYTSEDDTTYILTKTYLSSNENTSVYTGNNKGVYKFDKWLAKQTGDNFTNFYALYKTPINITKQPQDTTVNSGNTAIFSVDSDAVNGVYEWYSVNNTTESINVDINEFVLKNNTYKSNIEGIDNGTASMSFNIKVDKPSTLKIEYDIDSEHDYDKGTFTIAGPNDFKDEFEISGGVSDSIIFGLEESGQYIVNVNYRKDSGVNVGLDCLVIKSISLNNNKAVFNEDKIDFVISNDTKIGSGKELRIENTTLENDGNQYKCVVTSPNTDYVAESNVATLHIKQSPTANFYMVDTNDLTLTQFDSRSFLGTGKVKSISNTLHGEQAVTENIVSLPNIQIVDGKDLVFFHSNFSNGAYEVYGTLVDSYTTNYEVKYNGDTVKVGKFPEKTDFSVSKVIVFRNGQVTRTNVTDFNVLNKVEKVGNNIINISIGEEKFAENVLGGDVPSGFSKEIKKTSQNSVTFSYKVANLNNGKDLKVSVYVDGKFYRDFSDATKEIILTNLDSNKEYNVKINFENNFGQAKNGLDFNVKTLPQIKSLRSEYKGNEYVGNPIDKSKVKVYAVFEDGTEKELDIKDISFDSNTLIQKEGNNDFDIKYENIKGKLTVNGIGIKQITGVYNDDAYVYTTLNKDKFKFEITYKDDVKKEFKYDDFTNKPASFYVENVKEQVFNFEYNDFKTPVTINPIAYNYITATYPSNREKVGTKFDKSKVTVTLYYNKNSKNEVKSEVVKDFSINGNETIVEGKNEYDVTFSGLKTTLNIEGYKETTSNSNNNSSNNNNNNNNNSNNSTQITTTPTPIVTPVVTTAITTPVPTEAQTRVQTGDTNNVMPYIFASILFVVFSGITILKLRKKND